MIALYLLLGIFVVAVLHLSLRSLARIKRDDPARYRKVVKAGGVVGLLVLAARLGLSGLGNLLWFLSFLLPFLRPDHSSGGSGSAQSPSSIMSREEAAKILGVSPQADEKTVRQAYRDLMQRNHPDTGGSEYLASQINQAKDVLLKK